MSDKLRRAAPLTPKQQRFVEEYLLDLNATQAAIRAGYSAANADKIGPELLGKTRVADAVRVALAARTDRTQVTQDWVVGRLRENVERALQAVPVTDTAGRPTGVYTYQGAVANGALAILAKHVGIGAGPDIFATPDGQRFLLAFRHALEDCVPDRVEAIAQRAVTRFEYYRARQLTPIQERPDVPDAPIP